MSFSSFSKAAGITAAAAIFCLSISIVAGSSAVHAQDAPPPPPQNAGGPPPPGGPGGPGAPPHSHPAPTNLKVLPRNLTGEQVHEIMEQWEGELGTGCQTCHAKDPKNIGPNGKPRLNFADDSKKEKQTARKMYTMVEGINANYIAKIDSSGAPVTCGTCHRGHFGPEPFVAPKEKEGPH